MFVKVKDKPGLKRDPYSKAVINTDLAALENFKRNRQQQEDLNTMNLDINNLKSELTEIKSLLMQLISSNEKKQG